MRKFGLIGYPLTHSFSKKYFTQKFQQLHLPHTYENYSLATREEVAALLGNPNGIEGFNVTIPYKEAVVPFLQVADPVVEAVGACNCIHFRKGRLYGFNTDVEGFTASISAGLSPHHRRALVLGTGGAAKAVVYALEKLGLEVSSVSRKSSPQAVLTYAALNKELMAAHQVIVNTTPLGMYPDVESCPDIPYEFVTHAHLLYDLTYNPDETTFLKKGKERGAAIMNGMPMLIIQAEASWRIWNTNS